MDAEEILARYPTVREAVAWTKLFVFDDAGLRESTRGRLWGGASLLKRASVKRPPNNNTRRVEAATRLFVSHNP